MEYSAYININDLADEAKKELEFFYEYLLFKYKKKETNKKTKMNDRFDNFLSNPIKVEQFKMLGREERNER